MGMTKPFNASSVLLRKPPSPTGEGFLQGISLIKTILQLNFLDLSQGNLIAPLFAELFLLEKATCATASSTRVGVLIFEGHPERGTAVEK